MSSSAPGHKDMGSTSSVSSVSSDGNHMGMFCPQVERIMDSFEKHFTKLSFIKASVELVF